MRCNEIIRFRDFISYHYEMLDYEMLDYEMFYRICEDYLLKLELVLKTELEKFE